MQVTILFTVMYSNANDTGVKIYLLPLNFHQGDLSVVKSPFCLLIKVAVVDFQLDSNKRSWYNYFVLMMLLRFEVP
jgi:hypothetical protein